MTKDELLAYIQSIVEKRYQGFQSRFAQDNNLSSAYVNDILMGRRDPGQKILEIVQVQKVVTYEPLEQAEC
jgi:hypothetical protein